MSTLLHDARGGRLPTSIGFEDFFREEYPLLVRLAYGIVRDTQLAEDVAQEVLIAAQRRFPEPFGSDHAHAWVKIATTHASLNAIRSSRRLRIRHARAPQAATSIGPEEFALAREQGREVRTALSRLPAHSATVLVLRHSGLSYAEIAQAMDVRVGQVGTMLRRAEAKFRKEVERATRS
ncbi:MAG: sigma-70 family RNA polymerase sigma factor [Acidimicrobiales bacterium]